MNDAQHAALQKYLRGLADRLLMQDWEVYLSDEQPNEGAWATAHIGQKENHVTITVWHPALFSESLQDQREFMVHEILHLHFARLDGVMTKLHDQLPESPVVQFAGRCFLEEHEIAVQRLARCVAPFMPLPPKLHDLKSRKSKKHR